MRTQQPLGMPLRSESALTGNAMIEQVRACHEAGMDAHLAKPLDIEQLQSVLDKFMSAERHEADLAADVGGLRQSSLR